MGVFIRPAADLQSTKDVASSYQKNVASVLQKRENECLHNFILSLLSGCNPTEWSRSLALTGPTLVTGRQKWCL